MEWEDGRVCISEDAEAWADLDLSPSLVHGSNPMVPIKYSPDALKRLMLFNAATKKGLKTKADIARLSLLVQEVIDDNSANYSAWYYKRQCAPKTPEAMLAELDYARTHIERSEKNYQAWFHRRWSVAEYHKLTQKWPADFETLDADIERDDKNYSAWSHRLWLTRKQNRFEKEIDYARRMIQSDHDNNSAWNHLFVCFTNHLLQQGKPMTKSVFLEELRFGLKFVSCQTSSENHFLHAKGLLRMISLPRYCSLCAGFTEPDRKEFLDEALKIIERDTPAEDEHPRHYLAFKAFLLEQLSETEEAAEVYRVLIRKDPVRAKLWEYRAGLASVGRLIVA